MVDMDMEFETEVAFRDEKCEKCSNPAVVGKKMCKSCSATSDTTTPVKGKITLV